MIRGTALLAAMVAIAAIAVAGVWDVACSARTAGDDARLALRWRPPGAPADGSSDVLVGEVPVDALADDGAALDALVRDALLGHGAIRAEPTQPADR